MKPTRRWVLVDKDGDPGGLLLHSRGTAEHEKYMRECCGQVRPGEEYRVVEVELREVEDERK